MLVMSGGGSPKVIKQGRQPLCEGRCAATMAGIPRRHVFPTLNESHLQVGISAAYEEFCEMRRDFLIELID